MKRIIDKIRYYSDMFNWQKWAHIAQVVAMVVALCMLYATVTTLRMQQKQFVLHRRPYLFVDFSGNVFKQ